MASGRPRRKVSLRTRWSAAWTAYVGAMDAFLLHDALGALWEFVGEANRFVDREQPWTLAKQAKAGDTEAADRLRGVLGDLLEACRVISLAAAPVIPSASVRVQQQLGLEFPLRRIGRRRSSARGCGGLG